MGFLAALKMFATLANPFLAFENQVGELIADFEGKKFSAALGETPGRFHCFFGICLRDRALHEVGRSLRKVVWSGLLTARSSVLKRTILWCVGG